MERRTGRPEGTTTGPIWIPGGLGDPFFGAVIGLTLDGSAVACLILGIALPEPYLHFALEAQGCRARPTWPESFGQSAAGTVRHGGSEGSSVTDITGTEPTPTAVGEDGPVTRPDAVLSRITG
ncbi:hypothetical protein BFF78_05445 [Streptomyces fodineus]|uniref:Uncharacterized protein n=1 Tax=Streptomyces fodineus TaxID=1904616 RepID=A0A1D7Y4Q8_9ACTN|nr:hypothetical protein BFF78_05445 [Streptomyces fodineus]